VFTVATATAKAGAGPLAPLAIGAALMVMVFAGGHISGAHYNPAVSTAVMLRGKIASSELMPYVVAQLIAGAIAGLIARVVEGGGTPHAAVAGAGKMIIAEFLFTFALCYVVLHVATSKGTEGNSFYGLAIGFTVAAGAFAVGGISGGVFNPAVALGGMVVGVLKWSNIWIYWIFQPLAAIAAAYVYLYVQPAEKPTGDAEAAEVT
jgi:aquaporin Z